MTAVTYRVEIDIAAPQDAIFDRIADLTRHGEWSADPLDIARVDPEAFRSTARSKGKTIDASLRVLDSKPPERFSFEATDLTGRWVHHFVLSPAAGGTHVERHISGELSGAQLVLFWLVLYPIKKPNARRALAKLKGLLESH